MQQSIKKMKLVVFVLMVFTLTEVYSSAIPASEKKQRVHSVPLSDKEHEVNGEHNNDYDHESFLGHEDSLTFDQLSPEESKTRLAIIVDKIDKNKDGEVTNQELVEWIRYVLHRYINSDTEHSWRDHNPSNANTLTWEAYQRSTFGHSAEPVEGSPTFEYATMIRRDKRRWEKADKNQDGVLDKEEFTDFLHPEEAQHMRSIVVDETLEDIDKDGDGYISLQEYIDDIWGEDEDDEDEDEADGDKGEPEWVRSEREQFANFRDKNHDGRLDREEIIEWIIPEDYDHSEAEAAHLIQSSDENRDGKLSKEEILDKYDLFVGSQATDFGEALTKHDEF